MTQRSSSQRQPEEVASRPWMNVAGGSESARKRRPNSAASTLRQRSSVSVTSRMMADSRAVWMRLARSSCHEALAACSTRSRSASSRGSRSAIQALTRS